MEVNDMMEKFIEMLNDKIEKEELLTIGIQYGDYNDLDSVVLDSVFVDNKIHIKAGWRIITLAECYEFSYDEFEEEYIFKYKEMTFYFS